MFKIIISTLFFFPIWLSAQDITGVWTGYIKTPGSQLEYELAISNGGKNLSGYSLIIYPKNGIENIGIKKAKIKQTKRKYMLRMENSYMIISLHSREEVKCLANYG